jgi:hypothetical protein
MNIRWAWRVPRTKEERNVYRHLAGNDNFYGLDADGWIIFRLVLRELGWGLD